MRVLSSSNYSATLPDFIHSFLIHKEKQEWCPFMSVLGTLVSFLKKIFDRIFWFHSIGFKIAAASKNILEAAAQNNKNR